jgi:hypothetical protein
MSPRPKAALKAAFCFSMAARPAPDLAGWAKPDGLKASSETITNTYRREERMDVLLESLKAIRVTVSS